MQSKSLQDQIFDIILSRYGRRVEAVEALCQLLNLGKDPIYRRLRNETFLSPQELSTLAVHYRISLDALVLAQSDIVLCNFNAFSRRVTDFSEYLQGFITDLETVRRLPNGHFFYASAEIPVLTYCYLPELISFKLYIWGRTTWNLEFLRERQFDFNLIPQPIQQLRERLLQLYLSVESTEMWSVNIMDNTLAQIEYHVYSGGFKDAHDALLLCDRLNDWMAHMRALSAAGKKFAVGDSPDNGLGSIRVYYNEMVHTNNTALIASDVGQMVYSAFCNPNFIKSSDTRLCEYTEEWFNNVMSKSTLISTGASEKSRDWFFRELGKKVERAKARIRLHIDENH
ncbi:MAG TPA: hypothetical protein PK971_01915 [Saprospiraceae bacterium]|nr:hypothetical protein [Saprospiraceae bacterium]HND87050.1 hypothetical protein [Saprospiraceae bacterium]